MLTEQERKEIDRELEEMETGQAGILEALKAVQRSRGWVSDDAVLDIAGHIGLPPAEVEAVATFYPMIYRKPVGRHIVYLCDSISCWIMGYDGILSRLSEVLGIGLGETTGDGRFTILPIACLGRCDHAPAILIDRDLYADVDLENIENILEKYK